MGIDLKRITVIGAVLMLAISGITVGLVLWLKKSPQLELEVWPRQGSEKEPLIQFSFADRSSWKAWVNRTDDFLHEYDETADSFTCSYDLTQAQVPGVCEVDMDYFDPCIANKKYGYYDRSPCVFMRLNKVLDWFPVPYNTSENIPAEMPDDLKMHLRMVADRPYANMVWVTCEGVTAADRASIGPIQYIPRRGFPTYYFPITDRPGYLTPLVAVYFEKPILGVLINVECKAWARNIGEAHGLGRFSLLID